MRLRASIFRWNKGDCSNGGISLWSDNVIVTDEEGDIDEFVNGTPVVRIVSRQLFGDPTPYLHVEPVWAPGSMGWMFGGCFVYTSDSRFAEMMGTRTTYPLALHDRKETAEQYEHMSR